MLCHALTIVAMTIESDLISFKKGPVIRGCSPVKTLSICICVLLALCATAGCSTSAPSKAAPGAAAVPAQSSAQPTPAPAASALAPAPPPPSVPASAIVGNSYIIGPGDSLEIFVWRNPELSTKIPVRPDGKISSPLVEDMVAVGKTPTQLARDIEKVLSEYVKSPQVNVIVSQPVSAFSQVKVIGQVLKPQSVAYREGMTVLDAVLAAGGLGQYAAGNRAKVVRMQGGKEVPISINLDRIIDKGDMTQNIKLQPGDVLVVPETRF
jgi:polysaccharide export outer membrane protein